MSSWFTPTTVDEHVGGAITFDFGGENCGEATSSGTVTAWRTACSPKRMTGMTNWKALKPAGRASSRFFAMGGEARGMVSIFFYGADAADTAVAEQARSTRWVAELLQHVRDRV